MKILRVHNDYLEPGGETAMEEAERRLLRDAGHECIAYDRSNEEIAAMGPGERMALPMRTVWNPAARRELAARIARERPDVVHFANTFPLISPLAYDACLPTGVPVVQTLHNYRLLCPAGSLVRAGRVCEECIDHGLRRSVVHGCYRNSHAATATVAALLGVHRLRGTHRDRVHRFVVPSEFARRKLVAGGIPDDRTEVKPNFAEDPGPSVSPRACALFVGRLSEEKGVETLLRAWQRLPAPIPLKIAGGGPLEARLREQAAVMTGASVEFLGRLPREKVAAELAGARFLVFPSECYETFGLGIAEAYAAGTPVVASRQGAMEEIVDDGSTGLLFTAGDADDLAKKVAWAWQHGPAMEEMGAEARARYEADFTPERNLEMLLAIYRRARETAARTA